MKVKLKKGIAFMLSVIMIMQNVTCEAGAANATSNEETVYYDWIEFSVVLNADNIVVSGEYEAETVELIFDGDEAKATVSENVFDSTEYSIDFCEGIDCVEDIDIDEIYEAESFEDVAETIEESDILNSGSIKIYDENNELIKEIECDGYEGQVAIAAAGTVSYYLLSAAVSIALTYQAYRIYQSSKDAKKGKTRGTGIPIDKNKVPGKKKKNKTVKDTKLPTKGEANSSTDLKDPKTGKVKQRRFYDENGNACLDIDFSHGGNHTFPHMHIWQ